MSGPNNIEYFRKKKKITQKELAAKLGVTQGAISQFELGTRCPTDENWQKMASIFNIEVWQFFEETEDENAQQIKCPKCKKSFEIVCK